MLRLLTVAPLFASSAVFAQTTLDITIGAGVCSYTTGPVSNGTAPGHLQATATSQSGSACGVGSTGSVTFGPASPATAVPATLANNVGTSSINFQVLNADTCVGTISPTTGASFAGSPTLCSKTGATQCTSPISATANFDNESTTTPATYAVTVTCNGTAGQAISTANVTVPPKNQQTCPAIANSAQGGQPFTRAATAVWGPYPNPTTSQDATSFIKVYGDTDHPAWPGHSGLVQEFMLPVQNYVSLAFTVPPTFFTGANLNAYGNYTVSISGYTAPISMSISTKCGDFSEPTDPGSSVICRGNLYIGNGTGGITWGSGVGCPLSDSGNYFFNFINADISTVKPNGGGTATTSANKNCGASKCADIISNGPAGWH